MRRSIDPTKETASLAAPRPDLTRDSEIAAPGLRDRIRDIARDLLIAHGYRGLRFADIAEALHVTRASIHYHFGDKASLIDEVVADYVTGTLAELGAIWRSGDDLVDKVLKTIEHHRARYGRFGGADGAGGVPWSLISRMRLDAALLTPAAGGQLRLFSTEIERYVTESIQAAKASGQLVAGAPMGDIVALIVGVIDSAGMITQNAGSFERLEHLYLACMRVVVHGYGSDVTKAKLAST